MTLLKEATYCSIVKNVMYVPAA